jgi:ketosteroid isomerase-like protein
VHAFSLILVAAIFGAGPQAAGDAHLREVLAGRYAAMKSAMAAKDEAAIRALLTNDFVSVDVNGNSQGADAMIKDVLALPPDPSRHSETTIESIRASGNTAVVEQRYHMTKETAAADGTKKAADLKTLSTDTWVDNQGVWRIAKTVTKQIDYVVDGITVAHKVSVSK